MTLLDVCNLVRHYFKVCLAIVIACTLLGAVLGFSKSYLGEAEYSAEAVLTVSEPTSTVSASELMPLVRAVADNVIAINAYDGVSISQDYDPASRSIRFRATASNEVVSIESANSTAMQVAEQMRGLLDELAQQYRAEKSDMDESVSASGKGITIETPDRDCAAALKAVSFTINDASQVAVNSGKSTLVKFALAGLIGGLLIAVCAVVVIDLVRAPVKGRAGIEKAFEVPLLAEESSGDFGQKLWANIQFMLNARPRTICLIPAGSVDVSDVAMRLRDASSRRGIQLQGLQEGETARTPSADIHVIACRPLNEDVSAVFDARRADATVVLVECWSDSLSQVSEVLREIRIADVEMCGIALLGKE